MPQAIQQYHRSHDKHLHSKELVIVITNYPCSTQKINDMDIILKVRNEAMCFILKPIEFFKKENFCLLLHLIQT